MDKTMGDEQAYPSFNQHGECFTTSDGLTKRELFAMVALQGLVANSSNMFDPGSNPCEILGNMAVDYADALIKSLNR